MLGLLPIYTGREPEGGAHLAGGRGLQVFQCCAVAQGDYPIAIALEGEAIYEIEQTGTHRDTVWAVTGWASLFIDKKEQLFHIHL